jgi:hypothetical protein
MAPRRGWPNPVRFAAALCDVAADMLVHTRNGILIPRIRCPAFNPPMALNESLLTGGAEIYEIRTHAAGPAGRLPFTEEMLRERPSGDLFGFTQDAGMGWNPEEIGRTPFLILSTQGGLRIQK